MKPRFLILSLALTAVIVSFLFINPITVQTHPRNFPKSTSYWYTVPAQTKFTDAQLEFLVAHYDEVMVKGNIDRKAVEKVKSIARRLNKDFVILPYTNAMFDLAFKPKEESAYAHNSAGRRIKETQYARGWSLMDLSSPAWGEFFVKKSLEKIDQHGFDGIFVDDMGMASGFSHIKRIDSRPGYATAGGWHAYTDEEWYQASYEFLDYVKKRLGEKLVVFNGLYHQAPQYDITLLEISDGGMREGFILTGRYDRFFQEAWWKKLLNQVIKDLNKYNKQFVADCRMQKEGATIEDRMFCFTSYLLINKPGHVRYSPPKCPLGVRGAQAIELFKKMIFELIYYPEMDVDIGEPIEYAGGIEGYYIPEAGLCIRRYSNGLVAVNPSTESRSLSLEQPYFLVIPEGTGKVKADGTWDGALRYEKVSQAKVPPQTGIILLSNAPRK